MRSISHSTVSGSTTSALATRPMVVAKASLTAQSGLPIISTTARHQWSSRKGAKETCPSLQGITQGKLAFSRVTFGSCP